jgi:hypothetical protein
MSFGHAGKSTLFNPQNTVDTDWFKFQTSFLSCYPMPPGVMHKGLVEKYQMALA